MIRNKYKEFSSFPKQIRQIFYRSFNVRSHITNFQNEIWPSTIFSLIITFLQNSMLLMTKIVSYFIKCKFITKKLDEIISPMLN